MEKIIWRSEYFCGNRISAYGLANTRVDYRTLAAAFDAVLANGIMEKTCDIGYWELDNGDDCYYYDENGNEITRDEYEENGGDCEYYDIYQCYIISASGAQILADYTNEIVWYNDELDLYVWGVTHWGTSWDYVLTDIRIDLEAENNE
jgi:hypothetical protein